MAVLTQQPKIFYQPPQDPGAAPDLAPIPSLSGPPSGPPQVFSSAPPMPRAADDPLIDQIGETNTRLRKLQSQDSNPYGSANNHPGIGGKILHALSVAGNIAGDIFAPNVMAETPGTQLYRQSQEGGLTQRLKGLTQQESEDEARAATTAKTQEDTAEMPGAAEDKHDESSALTREANARADELQHPQPSLAQAYATAVQRAMAAGQDPQKDPVVQHLSDAIVALQPGQNKAPEAPKTIQLEVGGKPHQMGWDEKTGKYDVDMGESGEKPPTVNVNAGLAGDRFNQENKNNALKLYQPALDSAERFNVMTQSYEKAVKDGDQQAMLNLLANHLGMTMGLQKGARLTKDIITEAQQSQPWLAGLKAHYDKDGYLSGVALSPRQMRQMVDLGKSRFSEDMQKARNEAGYVGVTDDGPARTPTAATINYYVGLANGNAAKAKELAKQDGWSVK